MNFYEILEISNEATNDEIKKAYRRLALIHHPDKGGNKEMFNKINDAYNCLIDEGARSIYDRELNGINTFEDMSTDILFNFFKSNLQKSFFENFKQEKFEVPNIEVNMPISLIDVQYGAVQSIDFERMAIIDIMGNTIPDIKNAIKICYRCRGDGDVVTTINHGFFIQQQSIKCPICDGLGYSLLYNYILSKKKCRFKHTLPKGILDGEKYIFKGDGDLVYDKKTHKFYKGDVIIYVRYDIELTNKLLYNQFKLPNISIIKVEYGDLYYQYTGNIFEFITGTDFNIPLLTSKLLLVKCTNLQEIKCIDKYGLPQLINNMNIEMRNLIITYKLQEGLPNIYLHNKEKQLLRQVLIRHYPKVIQKNSISIDLDNYDVHYEYYN